MKKICLLLLLSFLSLNLFCQVHWTKYENNPIMVPSEEWEAEFTWPCSVIYRDSIYHMWYWGGTHYENESIGYATSPDGISWTKYINNPVLEAGPEGVWDDNFIHSCTVTLVDSIFHMWYTAQFGPYPKLNCRIGHATSADGVNWLKDTNNPVMVQGQEGEWDEYWVSATSVIHDGENYQMWYTAKGNGSTGEAIRVGHAISPDGVNWKKDSLNPVLSPGKEWEGNTIEFPRVVFDGFNYKMWYSGGNIPVWEIGYATSHDGSLWEKYDDNPIVNKGSYDSWDRRLVMSGPIIDSSSVKYKMWYLGEYDHKTGSTGYAESDTRVPYLSLISNKPLYDSTDSVLAEIDLDGIINIVPDRTDPTIDSITKYQVASVEASANTEMLIALTELSIGKYTVLAVSSMGFVCTNPYSINLVENANPPNLELANESVSKGETILATSNKDGTIYLVIVGTTPENIFIQTGRIKIIDSIQVTANNQIEFLTNNINPKDYLIYARDIYGQFSDASAVVVDESTGIVQKRTKYINIFPNPANDILHIEVPDQSQDEFYVKMINVTGKVIFHKAGYVEHIDISGIPSGVYLISVKSKDFETTKKIVKL